MYAVNSESSRREFHCERQGSVRSRGDLFARTRVGHRAVGSDHRECPSNAHDFIGVDEQGVVLNRQILFQRRFRAQ